MDRQTYNDCMKKYISGAGKAPEERKLAFCAGAKICSGKAKDITEAVHLCQIAPPKEKKEKKEKAKSTRKANKEASASCLQDMTKLAECAANVIDLSLITEKNIEATLAEVLRRCSCGEITDETDLAIVPPVEIMPIG